LFLGNRSQGTRAVKSIQENRFDAGMLLGFKMKKLLFALSMLAMGTATASAADLPAKSYAPPPPLAPIYNWTGFYVGVNGGFIGSNGDTVNNVGTDTGGGGLGTALGIGAIPFSTNGLGVTGGMVGGTFGYNWQVNPSWVVGLEGDIDWVSAKASFNTGFITVGAFAPVATAYSRELNWLATFRGRVGVIVVPSFLFYGTAGGALGQTRVGSQFICPACEPPSFTEASTINTTTTTAAGWTAGAGVEWMFAPNWNLKGEYLFVDLGNHSSTIVYTYGATSSLTSTVKDTFSNVRVGVNYIFGGPVVAKY
jgi:outer membrane immunogenic protein